MASSVQRVSVEQIEEAWGSAFGLYAALLPSARAGICWALRAVIGKETKVVGPAYTCTAVHEAMGRSGGQLHFVDAESNGFLMDPAGLASETNGDRALILSEIYGYPYDPRTGVSDASAKIQLRIFDSAMTVPTNELCARVGHHDCVVSSFGVGKCLYSGFGGIILTRAKELIDEVRSQRDTHLRKETLLLFINRAMAIGVRTVACTRSLYSILHKYRRRSRSTELNNLPAPRPFPWFDDAGRSKEWYLPTTQLDRWLSLYNLERRIEIEERRRYVARRYHRNLVGIDGITVLPPSRFAMSHFTIRVPSQNREGIQAGLWELGVDAGTLFKFPSYLSAQDFPNTKKIASEVLNLPLEACLTDKDVDYISDCVIRCVSEKWSTSGHSNERVNCSVRVQRSDH